MGTPEMIVIGACAWALLGPKELYRLSGEAGKFLGEWQQLGMQAKQTFTDAIETEMAEDEEAKMKVNSPMPETSDFTSDFADSEAPTVAEMQEQRRRQELEDAPPLSGFADDAFDFNAIGDELEQGPQPEAGWEPPSDNKFAQQLAGDTNRAVMDEFPAELGSGDLADDFEAEEIREEEDMLDTRIAEAENMLKMLATEQKVLELRREQQAANAANAATRRQAALADNIDGRLPAQTPTEKEE